MWEPPALVSGTWQRIATFLYSKKENTAHFCCKRRGFLKRAKPAFLKKVYFLYFLQILRRGTRNILWNCKGYKKFRM